MLHAVLTDCTSNASLWTGVVLFESAFTSYTGKLQLLDQLILERSSIMTGVKKLKDKEREAIAQKAFAVASGLKAIATVTGNILLKESMSISLAQLKYRNISETIDRVGRIADEANLHAAELAAAGIPQSQVDELSQLRHQLTGILGSTREALIKRNKNTQLTKALMKEMDGLLKNSLDPLVEVLRAAHPGFAISYTEARSIIDYQGKKNPKPGTPLPPEDLNLPKNPHVS